MKPDRIRTDHPTPVQSREKAIEYCNNNSIQLLILDILIDPGIKWFYNLSGNLNTHPKQKAVIVSGYAGDDLIQRTRDIGAEQFLGKPYSRIQLAKTVKKTLKG